VPGYSSASHASRVTGASRHAPWYAARCLCTVSTSFHATARESRALRRLQRDMIAAGTLSSPYVFVSERGSLTVAGYQRMVARAGEAARFGFLVHSRMLRHGCGYKLANDGQDTRAFQHYLGHRSIASTVRYTALAPDRFKGFWKD